MTGAKVLLAGQEWECWTCCGIKGHGVRCAKRKGRVCKPTPIYSMFALEQETSASHDVRPVQREVKP